MDWLDIKLKTLKNKINNLSLKKYLMVYIVICVIIVVALTALTHAMIEEWDRSIWMNYVSADIDYNPLVVYYNDYSMLSTLDRIQVEIIDFLQTWCIFIYSFAGIIGTTYLFYNRKMKEPLNLLKDATDKVGRNDLDFEVSYQNEDEMGELCRAFDLMRSQLSANNEKMWNMMEEQKRLNAAFAHDLRTPLTILRGYTDLLSNYVPEGKISQEKLLSTLALMSSHITRLENYSNTMKEISTLEDIPLRRKPEEIKLIENRLREVIDLYNSRDKISISLLNTIAAEDDDQLSIDENILMEVYDNLISNAVRYAEKEVKVILSRSKDQKRLQLCVADDGKGFSKEELIMATKPYYRAKKDNDKEHFGIGLYICKLLCEKHYGRLTLGNGLQQGAMITAEFSISED
jgi:two-component system, OmpR family, lantibiotic biosynthesis sensor histidine kinase NisK/SpaK